MIEVQVDGDAVEIGCTVVQALVLVRHTEVERSTVSVRVVECYPLRYAVYTTFIYLHHRQRGSDCTVLTATGLVIKLQI